MQRIIRFFFSTSLMIALFFSFAGLPVSANPGYIVEPSSFSVKPVLSSTDQPEKY